MLRVTPVLEIGVIYFGLDDRRLPGSACSRYSTCSRYSKARRSNIFALATLPVTRNFDARPRSQSAYRGKAGLNTNSTVPVVELSTFTRQTDSEKAYVVYVATRLVNTAGCLPSEPASIGLDDGAVGELFGSR
jgi:hypothetical protein